MTASEPLVAILAVVGNVQKWTAARTPAQQLALGTKRGKEMKRFSEVLPAAGLVLLFVVLMSLQLFGFDFIGNWTQTTVGTISWIFGLLILGLCIIGPLIWGVLYLIKRTHNTRL